MKPTPFMMNNKLMSLLLGSLVFFGASSIPLQAALNFYVELSINGTAVDGDVTVNSIGGVDVSLNHLECHGVNHEIFGGDVGRPSHTPFKLIKRVDKATPLLYEALGDNKRVDAVIKFFNNDQDSGVTQHFFTVQLTQGKISSVRQWIPNNLDPAGGVFPPMEEVSITYQTISWTSETGTTEYQLNVQ